MGDAPGSDARHCDFCQANHIAFRYCQAIITPDGYTQACPRCERFGIRCYVDGVELTADWAMLGCGQRRQVEFTKCHECIKSGKGCDRMRPCLACQAKHPGDLAAAAALCPLHGRDFKGQCPPRANGNVFPAASFIGIPEQTYFLAMGYGPAGVDDPRPQDFALPGPEAPLTGRHQVINSRPRQAVLNHPTWGAVSRVRAERQERLSYVIQAQARAHAFAQAGAAAPSPAPVPGTPHTGVATVPGTPQELQALLEPTAPTPGPFPATAPSPANVPQTPYDFPTPSDMARTPRASAPTDSQPATPSAFLPATPCDFFDPEADPSTPRANQSTGSVLDLSGASEDEGSVYAATPRVVTTSAPPIDMLVEPFSPAPPRYFDPLHAQGHADGIGQAQGGSILQPPPDQMDQGEDEMADLARRFDHINIGAGPHFVGAIPRRSSPGPLINLFNQPPPPPTVPPQLLASISSVAEVPGGRNPAWEGWPCSEFKAVQDPLTDETDEVLCGAPTHGTYCADRHHDFAMPVLVCAECSRTSATAAVNPFTGWSRAEILDMRAFVCADCYDGHRPDEPAVYSGTGYKVFGLAPQAAVSAAAPAGLGGGVRGGFQGLVRPVTGCDCAGRLLGQTLCSGHRAELTKALIVRTRRMNEWRVNAFGARVCPACAANESLDQSNFRRVGNNEFPVAGGHSDGGRPLVWACLACGEYVVAPAGLATATIPGGDEWFQQ
jgi:hypothetical protein